MTGIIRAVLGDVAPPSSGRVYMHEHLILDSPLIESKFPHIHLPDVDAAVEEVSACAERGVVMMVDAMPISDGRDAVRLAEVSRRSGVSIVTATGLHHDRYYGPLHWTNRVPEDELIELFVADLMEGVDEFDYTGPIVRRTPYRAGILKVATSAAEPDARDLRNLSAVAAAHRITGAPVITHCEQGWGGLRQIEVLSDHGVTPSSIVLSHVDKTHDFGYLRALAETGAYLELDQSLREHAKGAVSITVRAVAALVEQGAENQIVLGTDGARRSLWSAYGGMPGLAWLTGHLPQLLKSVGVSEQQIDSFFTHNPAAALAWEPPVHAA